MADRVIVMQDKVEAASLSKVNDKASKGAAKAAFKTSAKHIGKGLLSRVAAAVLAISMIAGGMAGAVTQVSAAESFPAPEIPGTGLPDAVPVAQNENEQLNLAYEAYLGYLEDHRKDIDQYNWQTTWRSGRIVSESGKTVAIADIMGDDIPELIYMQVGANTLVNLYIVTYRNGNLAWVYSDDSTFWDGKTGGGFNYYLFRVKGDTALYGYLRPAFESDGVISCSRFSETAVGMLERAPICEEIIHAGFHGNGYVETHNYRVDGEDSTQDGYAQKMEEIKSNITEFFQYSLPIAGEGESLSNRFDLQTMVQAMTCEEAIQYLRGCIGNDTGQEGTTREIIDVATLPSSLNAFLKQFNDWYGDATGTWENNLAKEYDCAHAADGTSNILASIVNQVTPSCVDFSRYPGVMPKEYFKSDPRGWSTQNWYVVYDGPTVDWVAKNIFNITDEEISALLTQGENQRWFYKEATSDGSYQYYAPIAGGIGDPMTEVRLRSAEFDGQKYYVTYDVYFAGVPNANPPIDAAYRGSYYAEVEYKTIDGRAYWSMYKNVPESKKPGAFLDVPADQWYAEPVAWAVEKGVTNGVTDTLFKPDNNCTRGQIVTFLWRANGSPEPASTVNPFVDVPEDQYYYKAVLWAVEKNITTGIDETHFKPNDVCKRGQAVTFLWRAAHEPPPTNSRNQFADVPNDQYYYKAVLWAVEQNITTGTTATTFKPDNTCTRGHIVTFLYRNLVK